MKAILLKGVLALVGAAIFIILFWIVCAAGKWDAPIWAYFIVGWMGHNDAYDFMTYKLGM